MRDFLYDRYFLKKLTEQKNQIIQCKIVALDFVSESPLEVIEGQVTGGSISIDGSSPKRRTCSLSLISDKIQITDAAWGVRTKIKIELGVYNYIDKEYPPICWFKMGIFVLTGFSTSVSTNSRSITLSGQDKMCLLDGTISGQIMDPVDFGVLKLIDGSNITIEPIVIKDIIKEAVHTYASEDYENIFINDIENYGLMKVESGKVRYYPLWDKGGNKYVFFLPTSVAVTDYSNPTEKHLLSEQGIIFFNNFNVMKKQYPETPTQSNYTTIYIEKYIAVNSYESDIQYYKKVQATNGATKYLYIRVESIDDFNTAVSKFGTLYKSNGFDKGTNDQGYYLDSQTVVNEKLGYKPYELTYVNPDYDPSSTNNSSDETYASSLKMNPGETIVQMLQKICDQFGNMEFFYDIDGHFVFQKRFVQTSTTFIQNDLRNSSIIDNSPYAYVFDNNLIISSFSNQPKIDQIRNDFCVWGTRKINKDTTIPIHLRIALDTKPQAYRCVSIGDTLKEFANFLKEHGDGTHKFTVRPTDLAKHIHPKLFIVTYDYAQKQTPQLTEGWNDILQCYIRIDDWREIIYQMAWDYYHYGQLPEFKRLIKENNPTLYPSGITGYEQYYIDIMSFWRDLYAADEIDSDDDTEFYNRLHDVDDIKELPTGEKVPIRCWKKDVFDSDQYPLLDYWIDFYNGGDLNKYSVSAIGQRILVNNKTAVTNLFYPTTPQILYLTREISPESAALDHDSILSAAQNAFVDYWESDHPENPNWVYKDFEKIELGTWEEYSTLNTSSTVVTGLDTVNQMISEHTYFPDTINITTIPVYYLEPNTTISIDDKTTGVYGEYYVDKINISLAYNGTMTVNAVKLINPII